VLRLTSPGNWSSSWRTCWQPSAGGTPTGSRALTCFWEAVLALRWFRDRASPDALARDHDVPRATAYRYLDEVIEVLASQAPGLRQALEKAHAHGGNIQAVTDPGGFPLWVSDAEPGSVHDLTAARGHALPALYRAAATGLPTLADPGYEGAGIGILIPVKQPIGGRELAVNTRTRNAIQRSLRCLGERGFACSPAGGAPCSTSPPAPANRRHRPRRARPHQFHGYIT
jgi:hypothetical protein